MPPAEPKKRQFAAKEFDDIVNALQGLELSEERHLVEDFIESEGDYKLQNWTLQRA